MIELSLIEYWILILLANFSGFILGGHFVLWVIRNGMFPKYCVNPNYHEKQKDK